MLEIANLDVSISNLVSREASKYRKSSAIVNRNLSVLKAIACSSPYIKEDLLPIKAIRGSTIFKYPLINR